MGHFSLMWSGNQIDCEKSPRVFTVLHISDLHRSRDEPVDNDTLIAALLADSDRYITETPIVPRPDAIVVSGDIIQGAPISHPNWQAIMREQYEVAQSFLDQLVKRFLDGDRGRLILIPGNHDVCWNTSFSAMERVPDSEYPADVRSALTQPDSVFRWSWTERALYRIKDAHLYGQRLDAYWEFVRKFYEGIPLLLPIDPRRGFQVFELCSGKIVIVAFDSVTGNDCFGYSGAIPRGAVARADLLLRDRNHSYALRIATWHHSIQGPPLRDDYMEVAQVHEMAGLHFQLGMHGHQHVAATTTHYVHLSESQSMAVISAGSLCAGSKELPRGVNRQYNVVVIEDDFRRARVHVREAVEGEQFSRKTNGGFPEGYAEVSWQAPSDVMGREINTSLENARRAVLQAEDALNSGDPREALKLLCDVELAPDSYARKIAIKAASNLDDPQLMATTIKTPYSEEETILLIFALLRIGDLDGAGTLLNSWPEIDSATRKEIEGRIANKKAMRIE